MTARRWIRLALVLPVAFAIGCLDPKIDGSTPAAAELSLAEIKRDLSAEERARLKRALIFIVARELGNASTGAFGSTSTGTVDRSVAAILDGKTVGELIAYVEALRLER